MKPVIIAVLIAILIVLAIGNYLMGEMELFLPQANELKNCGPSGGPQYVKGEDLFFMIDGGAEIFYEYGFKQAIAQGYKKKDGKPGGGFNLEIYEMSDPEAAYGIYTFKTGSNGSPLNIGDEGLLEDYYLNVWKGNFLVTITGFDSGKETIDNIIDAAVVVAAKIKTIGPAHVPPLIDKLPIAYKNYLKPNGIKYFKGNLGLFNQYEFDSSNIFGLKEGVMGNYRDFNLFLFKYNNAVECKECIEKGRKRLCQNPRFKFGEAQIQTNELPFFMTDRKGIPFYIKNDGAYIFIVQGKTEEEAKKIIGAIKD